MTQTIEQLQARVAELEAENAAAASLNGKFIDKLILKEKQLLLAQANNKRLRDALQTYIDEHEECQDADDGMAMVCSIEAHHVAIASVKGGAE